MASAACTALRCTAPTGAVLHAPQIRHGTWNGTGRRPRVVCVWGGPVADALLSPEVLFSLCSVCCAIHGYYSAKGAIIDGMPGDDRVLTSPPCPPQDRGPAHGEPQSRHSTLPRRRPLLIEIEMMHCTATALQLPPPATAAHCALAASAVHVQHRLVRARFSSRHHHWAVDPAMVVVHAVQRRYLQKSVCRLQRSRRQMSRLPMVPWRPLLASRRPAQHCLGTQAGQRASGHQARRVGNGLRCGRRGPALETSLFTASASSCQPSKVLSVSLIIIMPQESTANCRSWCCC